MNTAAQAILNTIGQTAPALGQSLSPQGSSGNNAVTVVVELGPQTLRVLSEIQADLKRIADHFDPLPPDVVDTPYIAQRLGCTTTWIAQMVRDGEIPKGCIVSGSGKGRQWKFHRRKIEEWLASK